MGQILVKDIDDATIAKLQDRAARHARSLEAEACAILEGAAKAALNPDEMGEAERAAYYADVWARTDRIRESLAGTHHTDSAILVRETRDEA